MNYTIEIEEEERTLEFQLDVNIWEDRLCECANIEFDIDSVQVTNDNGVTWWMLGNCGFFYLIEDAYKSKIENLLEANDDLLEAWKKHVEEV